MAFPAVLPVLTFVAGLAAGVWLGPNPGVALAVGVLSWSVAAWTWQAGQLRTLTAAALVGFGSVGAAIGSVDARQALNHPLAAFHAEYHRRGHDWPVVVEGRLREDATPTDLGVSLTLDVERVQTPCGWLPAPGGLRLTVTGALALERHAGWRAGRRLRATASLREPAGYRNPGSGDEELALARRGLALIGTAKSAALVELVAEGHVLAEGAAAIRAATRHALANLLPERPVPVAVVTAILIGDRGGLPPDVRRRLQEAGTYHVIAISGGNIAILAGVSFFLLGAFRLPPRAVALALVGLLCAYGYIAGGGPSVARATLAAVIYLLARAADHRTPAFNALAVVAFVAVVREPLEVFDPGLWLSYGATLAILAAAARVERSHRARSPILSLPIIRALVAILAGTIAAELALFPVGAYVFQRITIAGLVLNFVAIPLMSIAQLAGLVAVVLAWLPPVASIAARLAGAAASGLIESARLVEFAPWLTWRVPPPSWVLLVAYYGALAIRVWTVGGRLGVLGLRQPLAVVALLAGLAISSPIQVSGLAPVPRPAAGELRLTFIDVGQGDSALVEFPGGVNFLVDAAGLAGSTRFDLGERVIGPALLAFGVRRLDVLAITHGDPDHVGGALAISRDFRPRELWEGVAVPPHADLRALHEQITSRGGALRIVRPDDRVRLGGVELRVLHPPEPDWERQRVRNDDSIVVELRYDDVSIVLPGDIGADIERTLAPRLAPARIRVLKAAHHGSASSTSDAWLDALAPRAVVFSCGRGNRYGHPAPPVLARVRARDAEIYRTDEDGAVTMTTDGKTVEVRTFTGRVSRLRVSRASREGLKDRDGREGGRK